MSLGLAALTVLILTALADEVDTVIGLDAGADELRQAGARPAGPPPGRARARRAGRPRMFSLPCLIGWLGSATQLPRWLEGRQSRPSRRLLRICRRRWGRTRMVGHADARGLRAGGGRPAGPWRRPPAGARDARAGCGRVMLTARWAARMSRAAGARPARSWR